MLKWVINKDNCCGCTACMLICPNKAIRMVVDAEGFEYPIIDTKICGECGLCRKVCPFRVFSFPKNTDTPGVYAAKHKSFHIRKDSSSGGAFTAFANFMIGEGGVVYGVAFNGQMRACHMRVCTREGIAKFRGSKYSQSSLSGIFASVKSDLENLNMVFFTGTPCQVAGLKNYLSLTETDTKEMVTSDFVCHGVPSPLLFENFIRYCEQKHKSIIVGYRHRSKELGWGHTEKAFYINGVTDFLSPLSQAWRGIFYSGSVLRPSCYNCKFARTERSSDITLGDFWGVENIMPEFYDAEGVSLIIINTEKGREVFEKTKPDLFYRKTALQDCLQPNLCKPTEQPVDRSQFWAEYWETGFSPIVERHSRYHLKKAVRTMAIYLLYRTRLLSTAHRIKSLVTKIRCGKHQTNL